MSSSEHIFCQQELQTMVSLPAYEPLPSPAACPLNPSQSTYQPPIAFLPTYSAATPSRWWEEAAVEVFRTSHDFGLVTLTVKFIPLSDPTVPASLLSGRLKGWLDAFLSVLCRDKAINVPTCNSLSSTAETIVAIINRRPSSRTPQWEGDWLFSALLDSNISTVADKLDNQIHSVFCTITYADWIAWRCGYRTDIVSNFLDALLNFRNSLVQFAQEHRIVADKLLMLQKALPSRQPLPLLHWMISTAVCGDTLSDPSDALRFFLEPITQQFEGQCLDILRVCQKLSILDARFRLKVIHATDPKWPIPFSIDFSVWESIQKYNPQELAESHTRSVEKLFSGISVRDLESDDGYMKDVARTWSDYTDDFLACLSADKELTRYFMHLAENLIRLRNLFSAAAVGLALAKWGYQPRSSSPVWDIINPKDSFAGCRRFMAKNPTCLAYLFPYIQELRRSGNAPEKTLEFYQIFLGHLDKSQEAKVGQITTVEEKTSRKGIIDCTYSLCQTMHSSNFSTLDLDITPGPAPLTTDHLTEYHRADDSYAERVLRVYDEQSFDGSEATEATEVAPENEIKATIERNFPVSSKQRTSGGIAAKIEDQAHSSFQQFAKPCCCEQGSHGFDRKEFDSDKHLIFSPPEWVWSLADMQLSDDNATSSFAVSGAFPLFSATAIKRMREELLTNKAQRTIQTSNSAIMRRQLRGMVPRDAEFTYNAWYHPKTLAAISKVAGIDLVPVMDIEVSHLNILYSNSLCKARSVDWHRDDYPYACVLMLSDTTHITEGHTLLKMGSGAIAVCDCPKMGFAYVLQGYCIEHAIQAFEGCSELIISVTSFRPRNPFLSDQTQLSNAHTISDSSQLYFQFCQYRWAIAIERLTALRQILDGKQVLGWVWNSTLLGENFEEIRRFLQETREQLGMTGNNAPIPTKSKSNAIDLTNCARKKLDMYAFGLCQAVEKLALGVQQQQDKAGFEARLAQSTFECVDYILRITNNNPDYFLSNFDLNRPLGPTLH